MESRPVACRARETAPGLDGHRRLRASPRPDDLAIDEGGWTCGKDGQSIPVGVGIVSLVSALTLPAEQIQWSGWVYFSMIILVPLHDFLRKRGLKAAQDGS